MTVKTPDCTRIPHILNEYHNQYALNPWYALPECWKSVVSPVLLRKDMDVNEPEII
jgi:hypothetical protein